MLEKGFNPLKATTRAALAKVPFTFELARRTGGTGVSANTFHPGIVRSGLASSLPWFLKLPASFAMPFASADTDTGLSRADQPGRLLHVALSTPHKSKRIRLPQRSGRSTDSRGHFRDAPVLNK